MASRNSMPSLAALLGLLAVAGYQNRDKLGQLFDEVKGGSQGGGLLGNLGGMFGGGEGGSGDGSLTKGLGELVESFRNGGHQETADSWVSRETPSKELSPEQVETTIGKDTLKELADKTGLDYAELVKRLSQSIPQAVDHMTPHGELPSDDDQMRQWLGGAPRTA